MMSSTQVKLALADSLDIVQSALPSILESKFTNARVLVVVDSLLSLLDKLSKERVIPDIAIVEVRRPVLDDCRRILSIRKKYPELKIVAVSDFENEYIIGQIFKSGAIGFVKKEHIVEELLACIPVVQEDNYYISSRLPVSIKKTLKNAVQNGLMEFSDRELEFLKFCVSDYSLKEIAAKMFVSVRTVENYKESLTKKLMIKSKNGLGIYAVQAGLV